MFQSDRYHITMQPRNSAKSGKINNSMIEISPLYTQRMSYKNFSLRFIGLRMVSIVSGQRSIKFNVSGFGKNVN